MNDITNLTRELNLKQGEYDYEVEIFRHNKFFISFISQVRIGDCFMICNKSSWFKGVTSIKRSCYQNKISFVLGTVEILQAKPIISNSIKDDILKITYTKD